VVNWDGGGGEVAGGGDDGALSRAVGDGSGSRSMIVPSHFK
jgi:hypothetical protein